MLTLSPISRLGRIVSSGKWVGRVGHWNPEGWPEPEVGWTIYKPFWRKGYAKEAGQACTDYAFDVLGWPCVVHTIAMDNVASIKTAQAIGSKLLYTVDNIPAISGWRCWREDPFEQAAGPFYYRVDELGPVAAFRAGAKHMNLGASVHGGCLMSFADFAPCLNFSATLKRITLR